MTGSLLMKNWFLFPSLANNKGKIETSRKLNIAEQRHHWLQYYDIDLTIPI